MLGFLGGCVSQQSNQLYHWGSYEKLIYQSYAKPGFASPQEQISQLEADLIEAQGKGLKVAPGVNAHLASQYASVGDMSAAQAAFEREKLLYPESAYFVNGLLKRAKLTP